MDPAKGIKFKYKTNLIKIFFHDAIHFIVTFFLQVLEFFLFFSASGTLFNNLSCMKLQYVICKMMIYVKLVYGCLFFLIP